MTGTIEGWEYGKTIAYQPSVVNAQLSSMPTNVDDAIIDRYFNKSFNFCLKIYFYKDYILEHVISIFSSKASNA